MVSIFPFQPKKIRCCNGMGVIVASIIALAAMIVSAPLAAQARFVAEKSVLEGSMVPQSAADLCAVAQASTDYLNKGLNYDPDAIKGGVLAAQGQTLPRVKQTLQFVCQVQQADSRSGKNRLADPAFIQAHFEWLRWLPDKTQAVQFAANKPLLQNLPDQEILLTKYYIKLAKGNVSESPQTPYALYSLPYDEQGLSLAQAEAKKAHLVRYRFSKQQVLTGILHQNHWASPLLWLSRTDLEDTLMQGTVKVDTAMGSRFFNVHRNNGVAYVRGMKKEQQKRYWYFKETLGPMGYGKDANYKIPILPFVTVAGDIKHFGLGKLIMLSHNNEHRLVILADTGGAFDNNHYQLDYLGGYFKNWQDYRQTYRFFPDYFAARFLVVKSTAGPGKVED